MKSTKYAALAILGVVILPFTLGTGGKTTILEYNQALTTLHVHAFVTSYSDKNIEAGITLEGEILGDSFLFCQSEPTFIEYNIGEYNERIVIVATMSFQTHEITGSLGSCLEKDQHVSFELKPITKYLSIWDIVVAR